MLRSVCLVAAAAAAVVSADGEFGPARRQWQGVAAAVRDELSSMVNGQYGPQHAPSYEIVTPNVDAASITDIHVIFSNHLDVGFNVRAWCDGDDGERRRCRRCRRCRRRCCCCC